jgi:predicted nucleotidyltransferase
MSSKIQECVKRQLITPPAWLPDNIHYETIMGSVAYGVSSDTSDMDIYGFCMPPKDNVFPHLSGHINGFDYPEAFEQYQQHHIEDIDVLGGKGRMYDFTIYSITRYFRLLTDNNPNIIDSLFTAQDCVQHCTQIGSLVRENRKLFIHKGCYVKMKAYAYSQLHKMSSKDREGKRKESYDKFGFDVKFAYHLLRLIDEVEQLLMYGDLDLRRNREQLKACRRGEIPEQDIRDIATQKEKHLENLYANTKLPDSPPLDKIKQLLIDCLEMHYGNLSNAVVRPDATVNALKDIQKIVQNALLTTG